MKKLVDLSMLDRLDHLVRRCGTGTPHELARRLEISDSTLYEIISYMKITLKASIRYNPYIQSFMYDYMPHFYLGFEKDTSHFKAKIATKADY